MYSAKFITPENFSGPRNFNLIGTDLYTEQYNIHMYALTESVTNGNSFVGNYTFLPP